jgi:hypothetical protein
MTIDEVIKQFSPCEEGEKFLREQGTLEAAWDACVRSDWMLWLDSRLALLTPRQRAEFACRCVRETPAGEGTVWALLTDDRSRRAVETAEAFIRGEATEKELREAAAEAAWAAEAASRAATRATWAASRAAEAAAAAARAASRAAEAARAARAASRAARGAARAAWETAWATWEAEATSWDAAQAFQCHILREIAPNPFRNCGTVANLGMKTERQLSEV